MMNKFAARLQKVRQGSAIRMLVGVTILLAGGLMVPLSPASADTVDSTIKVGGINSLPVALAINPAGTFAYVANHESDTVSRINLATSVPVMTIRKSSSARTLATYANLAVPKGATISLRVAPSSAKYCKVSGTTLQVVKTTILKGVKNGSCEVTVTVKPKTGKSESKTVWLTVGGYNWPK